MISCHPLKQFFSHKCSPLLPPSRLRRATSLGEGGLSSIPHYKMIPETHAHGSEHGATYALLVGFCVMLLSDVLLGG